MAADSRKRRSRSLDFDVAYSLALADLQLKKLPQATVLFDEMKASMKSPPSCIF